MTGRHLSTAKIASALRHAGQQRYIDARAVKIRDTVRAEHLQAPTVIADAMGAAVAALVGVLLEINRQIATLETELAARLDQRVQG
jgi:hypothetical protein